MTSFDADRVKRRPPPWRRGARVLMPSSADIRASVRTQMMTIARSCISNSNQQCMRVKLQRCEVTSRAHTAAVAARCVSWRAEKVLRGPPPLQTASATRVFDIAACQAVGDGCRLGQTHHMSSAGIARVLPILCVWLVVEVVGCSDVKWNGE